MFRCDTCWWREGGRCYNEKIATITRDPDTGLRRGAELTLEFIKTCPNNEHMDKFEMLHEVFGEKLKCYRIMNEKS